MTLLTAKVSRKFWHWKRIDLYHLIMHIFGALGSIGFVFIGIFSKTPLIVWRILICQKNDKRNEAIFQKSKNEQRLTKPSFFYLMKRGKPKRKFIVWETKICQLCLTRLLMVLVFSSECIQFFHSTYYMATQLPNCILIVLEWSRSLTIV